MAHMVPPSPAPWRPGWYAERSLFEALQAGLPDDWHVFHDYAYLGETRPSEGAIDFLAVHRERGLLAIECKGHGVRLRGDGTWTRLLDDGREEPLGESPFRQAQRHVKELVAELGPKLERLLPHRSGPFPFVHGHAVAFPLASAADVGPLPAEASPEIVLLAEDLADLGRRVPRILEYWGRDRPAPDPLEEPVFRQFRRQVLMPRFRLVPSFAARLELDGQAIVRLSDEQAEILRSLVAGPRLCVRGGAGSGKTILALEAARAAAAANRSVLLTCYNIALARWLASMAAGWGPLPGSVRVATFHDLCLEAAAALGDAPPAPSPGDRDAAERYWSTVLPERLSAALGAGLPARYDVVVVDEGQDFRRGWYGLLEGCLRNPARGAFAVFYDPEQDIFRTGCPVPDFPAFTLGVNFRSTRRIAEYLRRNSGRGAAPFSRSPEGEEPVVHRQPPGAAAAARAVDRLVGELVGERSIAPGRITVIAPRTKENSSLRGVETLGGQRLSTDPLDREGAVLCTTVHKFKGLETDVAILVDVRPGDLFRGPAFLYTAASRARVLLHVFETGP